MSLVKKFYNKYLIKIGIKLCHWVPRKMGPAMIEPFCSVIAGMKNTDLIKAVRSNQKVISGDESLPASELDLWTKAVIRHALTCYYDFFRNIDNPVKMSLLFPTADELNREFEQAIKTEGPMVITLHLSNINLLFQVITKEGFRAKVLTLSNLYCGYSVISKIRSQGGAEIVSVEDGSYFNEIVDHLKSGGPVVTSVGRPVLSRTSRYKVDFFRKPSALPVGYISLAQTAGIPIIIVTTHMISEGLYEYSFSEKTYLNKYQIKLDEMILNVEMILTKIEELIKRATDQWLMYYPVWPDQGTQEL